MKSESEPQEVAFTTDQAIRLTGVTRRKLSYWIDQGLIQPDIDKAKGRGRVRLFSFRNLAELRVAVWLRDKVSLQLIRAIVEMLRKQGETRPLSDVTFGIVERSRHSRSSYGVVVQRRDGAWEDPIRSGQLIMQIKIPIRRIHDEIREGIERDRRKARRIGKVEQRRGALGSTQLVAGTRVPTKSVWSLHEAGYSTAEILRSYPGLQKEDVAAAIRVEERARKAKVRTA